MFNNAQAIEPFKLYGADSIIHNEEEAYEIIKKSSYYTRLYAWAHILFSFIFLYSSKGKDLDLIAFFLTYLTFGLLFLLLTYLIKKYLNKISLFLYALFPIGYLLMEAPTGGFMMLLHAFTLMAMYRLYKAISFIKNEIRKEIEVDPIINDSNKS